MLPAAIAGGSILLGTVLSALANRNKAEAAQQDEEKKYFQKAAQEWSSTGDHEQMAANMDALQKHFSPAVLQSLVTQTEFNNRRLHAAGDTSVPLSPYNTAQQAEAQGQPSMGIEGLNQHMASIPLDQRTGPHYQALLNQRGRLINQEDQAGPGGLSPALDQLKQANTNLDQTLNPPAPTPPAPAPPALQVPANRAPVNRNQSIKTAIGTQSNNISVPGTTGKEVLSSLISQASTQNLHPNEVARSFNDENIRRLKAGEPALDFDEAGMKSYREQHWEQTRATIQHNLQSQGVDPQSAFIQSAQITAQQLPNVPDRWMQYLQPHPEHQAQMAYQTAATQAGDLISSRIKAMQEPALRGGKPNYAINEPFLLQAVNSVPGLTPEMHTRLLHEMATTSQNAFLQAIQQTHPNLDPQQQNYAAMLMASHATGGNVPPQWRAFVERDMKSMFNLNDAQMSAYAALSPFNRPDPLDPDFRSRLQSVTTQIETNQDVRKAMLGKAQTIEGAAALGNMSTNAFGKMESQPIEKGGGKVGGLPTTPQGIGQMERNIQLQQEGKAGQQRADIERKNAVIPTAHMEKLQTADGIYKAGREAQQLAEREDKNGRTLVDKYGDTPGTFRDWWANIKGGVGRADPTLLAYKNRLAKVYNFERHELTGAATSVYEGTALEPYLPNPGDNVRTGLQKLNNLVLQMGDQLDQKLAQAQADYPRSNHGAFYRNQEKQKQAARKELDDVFNEAKQKRGR